MNYKNYGPAPRRRTTRNWYEKNQRLIGLVFIVWGSWTIFAAIMVAAGIFHNSVVSQVIASMVVGTLLIGIGLGKL